MGNLEVGKTCDTTSTNLVHKSDKTGENWM
jgi:hypothetical protein